MATDFALFLRRFLTAHLADEPAVIGAPRLRVADLRDLLATLEAIDAGTARSSGLYPRKFAVNASMSFATGFAWNNR